MSDDPQKTWEEYYERIRERRLVEANGMWSQMQEDGVGSSTLLIFDFRHFANDEAGIRNLASQLAENCDVSVKKSEDQDGYWLLDGTTRPDGLDGIDTERLSAWCVFMCDVAQAYGCVFSTWTLADESRSLSWSSQSFDS